MPRQDADDAWAAHLALKPAEEASSSRSKSAAAVPDIDAPSRTVRPPFRLFDPFSARLNRFQSNGSSKAPVPTSVATEFNPGEQRYHTINLLLQSIGKSAARGKRVERGDVRGEAPTPLRSLRSLRLKPCKLNALFNGLQCNPASNC